MIRRAGPLACAVLVVLATARYSHPASQASFLQKRVCRFVFHGKSGIRHHQALNGLLGDMTEGIRQLASHAEVPICFEELHSSPGQPVLPIEVDVKDTTVKDILDQMVSQDPRYVYRERLGVIEVLPQGADRDPKDCLNMVIPVFRVRYDWDGLIEQLRCEVDIVSRDPKAVVPFPGCGGSFPALPHPPPGLIEANFEKQTVRDILDLLCTKVGNMAWEASCEAAGSGHDVSIGVYQPRPWTPGNTVPLTFFEGLPKTCVKCHYHKPCRTK